MKSIIFERYGGPDVLQLKDVDKPVPNDNQILVKVHSAATNPLDWHMMRADPFFVRLGQGFWRPKVNLLGADIAGVVEKVGQNVTEFKPGDEVFGSIGAGGYAEYAITTEKHLALKPENVSFEDAASTPVVGLTAIQGMRDFGKVESGQSVLINGASGGIGTFAVQYAKAVGAVVTGVTSGRNLDLVRGIGADDVIDYTQTNFTHGAQHYDLIFDTIGNIGMSDARRVLTPQGRFVVAGFASLAGLFRTMLFSNLKSQKPGQKLGSMGSSATRKEDLLIIRDLLASGKIKPVIDRRYPLNETAQAIAYLETGRARGKVMITVV